MESALLWWLVFAVIGGAIGAAKGRVGAGILLGIFLGPLGLLIAPALKSQKALDRKNTKQCPYCAERVALKAKLCKHCGQSVESFKCPGCRTSLLKPAGASPGSKFRCQKCSHVVVLP